uniref:Uncharacterized protein n=1 Tax=Glossina austeni TaxID=7395 RepID=A0A1A9VDY9_GLOAU
MNSPLDTLKPPKGTLHALLAFTLFSPISKVGLETIKRIHTPIDAFQEAPLKHLDEKNIIIVVISWSNEHQNNSNKNNKDNNNNHTFEAKTEKVIISSTNEPTLSQPSSQPAKQPASQPARHLHHQPPPPPTSALLTLATPPHNFTGNGWTSAMPASLLHLHAIKQPHMAEGYFKYGRKKCKVFRKPFVSKLIDFKDILQSKHETCYHYFSIEFDASACSQPQCKVFHASGKMHIDDTIKYFLSAVALGEYIFLLI